MGTQSHWEQIYGAKAANEVSWYRPHLETSLSLIERAAKNQTGHIIDVGGGESTLVEDLLGSGHTNLTVLDISQTALNVTKARLGDLANSVQWIAADVTQADLLAQSFDIWHDRAVFHFLTSAGHREAYVQSVVRAVKPGGHVVIGTFGPEGPTKCSGLEIRRYDANSLHAEFGPRFRLIESLTEVHQTPFGTSQQFLYCVFRVEQSKDTVTL